MNRPDSIPDLAGLRFDNRFVAELPGDPSNNNQRREVTGACYSNVAPTPVRAPQLVSYSPEVAAQLDLSPAECGSERFCRVFAGNELLPGMAPYATCYGGHQFGNWAGQLGDGRAINLGEIVNQRGERWALQLKGAGPTPYSRTADGLAVLRSSLREYLCSEAMFHLGVPTTRALSLTLTGEEVLRDMFYDGNARYEPGAVVCRVAPSFTRFGHFQIVAARGEQALLQTLVDYTIRTDFADTAFAAELGAAQQDELPVPIVVAWFEEVCKRTAAMIVEWMRVGFVHGVMNTDNMSILGLTIDYGPYGWLENYDPDWTPNTTDAHGRRYRFGQQPQVALWNLVQLANAIYPLVNDTAPLERALEQYGTDYETQWQNMMAQKLGFSRFEAATDQVLVDDLMQLFARTETDMTLFFRGLGELEDGMESAADTLPAPLLPAWYREQELDADYRQALHTWLRARHARLAADPAPTGSLRERMAAVNPRYVLRNYLAQLAIDEVEQGNFAAVDELLDVLRTPYTDQPHRDQYAARRPEWARERAGCSMLSCSS